MTIVTQSRIELAKAIAQTISKAHQYGYRAKAWWTTPGTEGTVRVYIRKGSISLGFVDVQSHEAVYLGRLHSPEREDIRSLVNDHHNNVLTKSL